MHAPTFSFMFATLAAATFSLTAHATPTETPSSPATASEDSPAVAAPAPAEAPAQPISEAPQAPLDEGEPGDDTLSLPDVMPIPIEALHNRQGRIEVAVHVGSHTLTGDKTDQAGFGDTLSASGLSVGVGILEHLVLSARWTSLTSAYLPAYGASVTTDPTSVGLVGRYEFPLSRYFVIAPELELEAVITDSTVSVGGRQATGDNVAFGLSPRVVFITRWALSAVDLDLRIYGGFSWRNTQQLSVSFEDENVQREPIQLGELNLSGLSFGASLAITF